VKDVRITKVLHHLGLPISSYYHQGVLESDRKRRGPPPQAIPESVVNRITALAEEYPYWGYKRIAIIARREGIKIGNKVTYQIYKANSLLSRRKPHKAALYQAAKLYELLPSGVNELWQADVTYLNIPGHGWWYAVTVIDYYSRYLLALHFTPSYRSVDVTTALELAQGEAERIHGPLLKRPTLVTDNGSSFIAKHFRQFTANRFGHVRIHYRTPTQLGLLERFHQTLKHEEVYWHLYESPAEARVRLAAFMERYNTIRPHWALTPETGGDPVTPQDVFVHGVKPALPRWQGWARKAKKILENSIQAPIQHTPVAA